VIIIDGLIGGGQILRTALSLSALTGKPFKIINIRGKREKSGLQAQHLICVNSLAQICNAKLKGNELHSHELEFIPEGVKPGDYRFDIGTAGSTTLVLQTLLPALIFTKEKSIIVIIGGTANPLAPPAQEIKEVFLWWLEKIGIKISIEIKKEGFFPKGGGKIVAAIKPLEIIKELNYDNFNFSEENIRIIAVASKELENREVCSRMINSFKKTFIKNRELIMSADYVNTLNPGCYIHANYSNNKGKFGMTIIGDKRKTSEQIGKECAEKLLKETENGYMTDHFTADQLLIYMAIKGSGKIKTSQITEHIKTNIGTIEKFLDVKFEIEDNIIKCKSI